MEHPQPCRLLIDPPAPGAWNMGVDDALLQWAAEAGGACWRFYGWQEPTVSLGYFQDFADRPHHAPSRQCPVVRRLTGGGAIVHDHELTYSLVLPADHPLAARRDRLYQTIHGSLLRVLATFGLAATLADGVAAESAGRQPLLCFQRRAAGDVLVGPSKVCGSAQRRCRSAVLQHGSLLLRRSAAAPELPGLADLADGPIAERSLVEAWLADLAGCLGVAWQPEPLSEALRERATGLAETRYATVDWTEKRRTGGCGGRNRENGRIGPTFIKSPLTTPDLPA